MDPKTIFEIGDELRLMTADEADERGYYRENDELFVFPEVETNADDVHNPNYVMTLDRHEMETYGGKKMTVIGKCPFSGVFHIHYTVETDGVMVTPNMCPTMFSGYWEDENEIEEPDSDLFGFLFQA